MPPRLAAQLTPLVLSLAALGCDAHDQRCWLAHSEATADCIETRAACYADGVEVDGDDVGVGEEAAQACYEDVEACLTAADEDRASCARRNGCLDGYLDCMDEGGPDGWGQACMSELEQCGGWADQACEWVCMDDLASCHQEASAALEDSAGQDLEGWIRAGGACEVAYYRSCVTSCYTTK